MSLRIVSVWEPTPAASARREWELAGIILDELPELEDLALEFDIAPLSAFGDNREVPEGFTGDPEELERRLGPFQGWFACREGRDAVRGLLQAVHSNRQLADRFDNWIDLELALEALQSELGTTPARRFRLELRG